MACVFIYPLDALMARDKIWVVYPCIMYFLTPIVFGKKISK